MAKGGGADDALDNIGPSHLALLIPMAVERMMAVHVPDILTKGITDREKFQQLRDYLLGTPGPMPALVSSLRHAQGAGTDVRALAHNQNSNPT